MAPRITEADVRHVAQLSRLKLTDPQVHFFTEQLAHVLGYIDKLNELDVDGVEPMPHPTDMTNRFREDVPTPGMPIDQALRNAPDADPPFFKVPKVLGDGGGA
jgi:aspartyl-tRNA(Asn)/glutamyl-tRNA(Gln) amidotransferase subunit C